MNMIINRAIDGIRMRLAQASLGYTGKRDHYRDFGWPKELRFVDFKRMYERNSLATAAVDKTVAKTWETNPALWEHERPLESRLEKEIAEHFEDFNIWRGMMETDRRSMVGQYAAFIMMLADEKPFDQPVERVAPGITSLLGVVPCWENQLKPVTYNEDQLSPDYGKPIMFEFTEYARDNPATHRTIRVHADRVIVWSEDGTLDGRSVLEPGYNDLLDAEKVRGAGGEGFWKTARGAPIIEAGEGQSPASVAKNMGVTPAELIDKINNQLDDFQQGFDKGLMLGGMTAKPLQISLPNPDGFHSIPVNCFAASVNMPVRILLGNQTGERASTEDAKEWAKANMARRSNLAVPVIRGFIRRLVKFGILPDVRWTIGWDDLTEATAAEKLDRSAKMSDINAKTLPGDIPAFLPDEIREAAGYKPLEEVDESRMRDEPSDTDEDDGEDNPPPGEEEDEDDGQTSSR